jgi:PBP1b-binding outer membrane lipoprotein LpoB
MEGRKDLRSVMNQVVLTYAMSLVCVVLIIFITIVFGGCSSSRSTSKSTSADTINQAVKDFIPVKDLVPLGLNVGDSLKIKKGDIDFTLVKVSDLFYSVASNKKVVLQKETTTTFIPTRTKIKVNNKTNSDNKTKVDSHNKDKSKTKVKAKSDNDSKVKSTNITKTKSKSFSWWLWLILIALLLYCVYRFYIKIWPGGGVWKILGSLMGRK